MNLDAVTRALDAAPGVDAWCVHERELTSHQSYRIFGRLESARSATSRSLKITLHTASSKGGRPVIGEAAFTLTGDHPELTQARIADAVARARLVANPSYILPGVATPPGISLDDPELAADPEAVMARLERDMDRGVGPMPICASEIFADRQQVTVVNSEGFQGRFSGSELFAEFVVLAEDGTQSVECHGMRRARRPEEMDLEGTLARYGRWADDRLRAVLPPTGALPVVFGEEALETLFDTFVAHAGARARYEGWSRLTEGKPLLEDISGEPLTLELDPTLPWRLGSRPFDLEGQICRAVPVFDRGRLAQRPAAKRYADYLGIPATGVHGNQVVACGNTPLDTLLGDGPVLHALRFSTFHPNSVTGAFSGELRTAYLYDGERNVTPICGGSVSGNVWQAFRAARFASGRTVRAQYEGPEGVRLERVTVAGKV